MAKKFELPPGHKPGMRVPHGGSMCANCRFLAEDKKSCTNEYFIEWNSSEVIPGPIESYCSDWYEPGKTSHRWMK